MQLNPLSALALAVSAAVSLPAIASEQSESKGLIEDASATLLLRNAYFNRDFKDAAADAKV
ncbi:Porin D precursor [compost metagenome]